VCGGHRSAAPSSCARNGIAIDGHTEVMTVTLYDLDGKALFSVQLEP
jgi:hypothetical protein